MTNLFPSAAEPTRGLYSLQQARALARLADVTVIAPVPWVPRLPAWRWLAPWRALGRVPAHEVIHGLPVFHPRYVVLPRLGRRWDAASFARAIRPVVTRLVREGRAESVFVTWAYPDVAGTVPVAAAHGLPVVGGVLGSDINLYAKGWRAARIAAALRRCDAVVCVAEPLRQRVAQLGVPAERLHVILNGVDAERFRPRPTGASRAALGLPADRPLVVFIGNLVTVKGPDILVEAFARLCGARRAAARPGLVFIGAGEQAGSLARRVRTLGLNADVRFVGAQPHERIPEWLGAADVVCVPSRAEGCPNVVLEALAAGRPVVASRTGGIPDLVREGVSGLLVSPEDPGALAEALGQSLSRRWDPSAIRATVRGGWEANAQAVLQLAATGPDRGPTVLHVLRYSLPHMSGYTVRSQALIEGQRAHGVHPVVVTSVRHEAAVDVETINGVRYHRCRVSPQPLVRWLQTRVPLVRTLATMASLARTIERVARAEEARLIHAHSPVMCGFPALLAARRLRVPLLYEVRALWEDAAVDQEKTTEGSAAYRLARALETFVLRRADRIIVICEGLKRELIARGLPAAKIALSPNGVDPAAFRPLEGKDAALVRRYGLDGKNVIGFIGSFFQFEGLECLLRAVPHLRRLDPAIRVVIVGGGERERALRHQAQAAGLDGAVLFTGRVPHEQVGAYYSIMDALVYPRLSRRITELVTPLKPLEAMALQRPVIASDVGGLRELVTDGETGLLFKADDAEALAHACVRLVRDPALAQRLARQGRAFVERERAWDTICARNAALYRELAGVR